MADRFHVHGPIDIGEFSLSGPEAHHLSAVRRFASGDRVVLFNGDGREYPAEIITVTKRTVVLTVLEAVEVDREIGIELVVASAVPKGDRADFLVEKLTELGATRFIPMTTTRSVVVPKASSVGKFERGVIEASKQCGRNRLMAIGSPTAWPSLAGSESLPPLKVILHTDGGMPIEQLGPATTRRGIVIAVGPEGGFTPDEIDTANRNNWMAIRLGSRVMRVETAAVTAVSWISLNNPASVTSRVLPSSGPLC